MTDTSAIVLARATVTTPSFRAKTSLPVNSTVSVQVVPYNQSRRGVPTVASILLPDVTAPIASYVVVPQNSPDGNVTIQLGSLSDDVTQPSGIIQQINWGDGSPVVSADGTVTAFAHGYGDTEAVYHPVVTVTDEASNTSTYTLTVVVADSTAPTGSFTVQPTSAWAKWTSVTITTSAIHDDLSQPNSITKTVDWSDGNIQAWTQGSTLSHRYTTAGVFSPTLAITDEAGNTAGPLTEDAVIVTSDAAAPRLSLTLPRRATRMSNWTTVRGRANDAGTGVRNVYLRAIQQRGDTWYAYRPATKTWIRSGTTQRRAWRNSNTAVVPTSATHRWAVPLAHLKRGLLVYQVAAKDHVGNRTSWKRHQQALSR